jgi:hypothetical protein
LFLVNLHRSDCGGGVAFYCNPLDIGLRYPWYNASGGFLGCVTLEDNSAALKVLAGLRTISKAQSVFPLHKDHITIFASSNNPGCSCPYGPRSLLSSGRTTASVALSSTPFGEPLLPINKYSWPVPPEFHRHFLTFWIKAPLTDVIAQVLGRRATSLHPSNAHGDKHYREATRRLNDYRSSHHG